MTKKVRANIGLYYGSSTCYTEMAAEKIQRFIGEEHVDLFNIVDHSIVESLYYDFIIMGIPTWDYGELQEDWEEIWDDIGELDYSGKKVALFGLGDQLGYPEWFLDAMGYLHDLLAKKQAKMVGYWPNSGYTFEQSQALTEDKKFFKGLALDEENEFDLTQSRIEKWCTQILMEFEIT